MLTFERAIAAAHPGSTQHVDTHAGVDAVSTAQVTADTMANVDALTGPSPPMDPRAHREQLASATSALRTGRRESSVLPSNEAMLRAADTHGSAMFAAARRLFNVNDPNHDPEERFVDVCDSLCHQETPTPETNSQREDAEAPAEDANDHAS